MARQRKTKARVAKVKDTHHMLDASNELAAAVADISNKHKLQINGQLTIRQFPQQERHTNAKGFVHSYKGDAWQAEGLNAPKKSRAKKDLPPVYVVSASYSATK